jgi:hypothetical protein
VSGDRECLRARLLSRRERDGVHPSKGLTVVGDEKMSGAGDVWREPAKEYGVAGAVSRFGQAADEVAATWKARAGRGEG